MENFALDCWCLIVPGLMLLLLLMHMRRRYAVRDARLGLWLLRRRLLLGVHVSCIVTARNEWLLICFLKRFSGVLKSTCAFVALGRLSIELV